MKYEQQGDSVFLYDYDSFNIRETLECGQCFRFTRITDTHYIVIAHSRVLNVIQTPEAVEFRPTTTAEFENIWLDYFDLNRDYAALKKSLAKDDAVLTAAIEQSGGIRILNQDPYECLISFIISQNNRIPMIKQVIRNMAEFYGEPIGDYYSFPEAEQLSAAGLDGLTRCKSGFRARYILDAANKILSGEINIDSIKQSDTATAKKMLMSIYGVGIKVADCTLMFSFGRREVFPTDVWIKRVMEHFYFGGKVTPIAEIHAYARERFGENAGYANQYLFAYATLNESINKELTGIARGKKGLLPR